MSSSLVTELCALARQYLAHAKEEFAEAARARDYDCADAVLDGHAGLAAALERQEGRND